MRKQTEVLGGYDPSRYRSERLFATAPDGTEVPVSLVYRKDSRSSGSGARSALRLRRLRPQLRPGLQLRTACRCSIAASSSPSRTCAAARRWAGAGTRTASCWTSGTPSPTSSPAAEHLVSEGYTSPRPAGDHGGSAGGLLMGAVINLRPDLFRGAGRRSAVRRRREHHARRIAAAHASSNRRSGATRNEPEAYAYMKSYSPYDNVAAQGLSAHAGDGRAERSPGGLLGAGQVGRALRATKTDGHRLCCGPTWRPATAGRRGGGIF